MDRKAERDGRSADSALSWCEMRHYLGRLHSYRHAAEIIVKAKDDWPELFKNFTVRFTLSAGKKRMARPSWLSAQQLFEVAVPDLSLTQYGIDIVELQDDGLDAQISKQVEGKDWRTRVHAEIRLHDDLVQQRKTRPADFWESSTFIATSKPPCRLCNFYFNSSENNFQVQSSHKNLYARWRLPEIPDQQDKQSAMDAQYDIMEEIIAELQGDVERIVREKCAEWKSNDSRTNTYAAGSSVRHGSVRVGSGYAPSQGGVEDYINVVRPPTSLETSVSWSHIGIPGLNRM